MAKKQPGRPTPVSSAAPYQSSILSETPSFPPPPTLRPISRMRLLRSKRKRPKAVLFAMRSYFPVRSLGQAWWSCQRVVKRGRKNSKKMHMAFFVAKGRVTVTVRPTYVDDDDDDAEAAEENGSFSIGEGGFWQVPRGESYQSAMYSTSVMSVLTRRQEISMQLRMKGKRQR